MPRPQRGRAGRAKPAGFRHNRRCQFLFRFPFRVASHKQSGRVLVERHQRCAVGPVELSEAAPVQHAQLQRHHRQRVAVRLCLQPARVSGDSLPARRVDDVDRLPEFFFQVKRQLSRDAVRSAAGRPRTDESDRPVRIRIVLRASAQREKADKKKHGTQLRGGIHEADSESRVAEIMRRRQRSRRPGHSLSRSR